jgi:hypothetical protein
MKKLIFTLLLGLSLINAKAYYNNNSNLNLSLFDNTLFTIQFDDCIYNEFLAEYNIYDIESGNHYLKVIKSGPMLYGGYSKQVVVFDGYIYIRPGKQIFGMIDQYNRYKVIKQYPLYNNYGNNNNYPPPTNYNYAMSDNDFTQLKQVIENATFESSKIKIAEQAIAGNYFYAEQVVDLLYLFTFESSKLEIAKLAYQHTLNKEKYYIVNNAFTFESSIDELNQYILSH